MRIVITGGHHTTAFAVVDELKKHKSLDVLWLGHKYSMWGDQAESAEFRAVKKRGWKFVDLKAGKFYRTFHPLKLIRLPLGAFQAFFHLVKFKPHLILSFGGYLAVPVVVAGWFLRIPSVTHEQTMTAGFANRILTKFVKKVFVAWPESKKNFPEQKTVVTGNPLRAAIFKVDETVYEKYKGLFAKTKKVIYATGGKQGSHVINEAVKKILPKLLEKFNVIHQCGSSTLHEDFEELQRAKNELPENLRRQYLLKGYFDEEEIGTIYALCDLVVSRAGANTVYEIAALGKVAIFIPIPWLPGDEQTKNAQVLADAGSAEILPQRELTGESLVEKVNQVSANFEKYDEAAEEAKNLIRFDAAEKIVLEIKTILDITRRRKRSERPFL